MFRFQVSVRYLLKTDWNSIISWGVSGFHDDEGSSRALLGCDTAIMW
jgi:hypothetical protein